MIESDFMKLYEKLGSLNEKWYDIEEYGDRLWFSDSAIEFKNFMRNLPSTGLKGVRLCVAPDFYLVANAEDYSHDTMEDAIEDKLGIDVPHTERATCGIPRCTDFELGNFEIKVLQQDALEFPDDDFYDKYRDYNAEEDYFGRLIADYDIFELSLYGFRSREYPELGVTSSSLPYFEDSEIYRALKPLFKRVYIYGFTNNK